MNLKKGKFKNCWSALPYEVIMDKGDCVWVAGCTIQNVDTEVYIEEYSADVENEVLPDEDILENGFSRQSNIL